MRKKRNLNKRRYLFLQLLLGNQSTDRQKTTSLYKIPRLKYGLIMCLIWKISWTLNISWVLSLEFLKNILNIPQKSVYRKELTNNNTVNIFSFVKVIKGTNKLLYIYILVQVIHRIPLSELYNRQYITGLMYDLP